MEDQDFLDDEGFVIRDKTLDVFLNNVGGWSYRGSAEVMTRRKAEERLKQYPRAKIVPV